MTIGLKIVVAAINLVCLIVTLIYPNNATSIALLPCWITAVMWLYSRLSSFSGQKTKALFLILPLTFLVICGALSFCIGVSCDYVVPVEPSDCPHYAAKSEAIIPFDLHIDYNAFQIFVLIVFLLFTTIEIIFDFVNNPKNIQETAQGESTRTPTQLVNESGF